MATRSIAAAAVKMVLVDLVGDFLYFPVWWYTAGLKKIATAVIRNIDVQADRLALRLLFLNIFKPMFAQYDRTGRLISFFMRVVILIGRLIYYAVYCALQLVIVLLWVLLPLAVIFRLAVVYFYSYVAG